MTTSVRVQMPKRAAQTFYFPRLLQYYYIVLDNIIIIV